MGKSVYVAHNKSPELGDKVTPINTAAGKADGVSRGRQPAHQVVVIP